MDPLEYRYYEYCLANNKVYFGKILWAKQGIPIRYTYIQQMVRDLSRNRAGRPITVMEIGSWAGGSAMSLAEAIKRYNQGHGLVICVDPWKPYFESFQLKEDPAYQIMTEALEKEQIFDLFLHNIKAAGHDDIVRTCRGTAKDIVPLFGDALFDLIYLDGDHAYEKVVADLQGCMRLVAPGGILCGDDLELQISQVDRKYAWANRHMDYINDPRTGEKFHPGVTTAINEYLGEVTAWEGFWAMRRSANIWQGVAKPELAEHELCGPSHLEDRQGSDYHQFGRELHRQGHKEEAHAALEHALELSRSNASIWNDLGALVREMGNPERALILLQRAWRLEPCNIEVALNLSALLIARKEQSAAINILQETLRKHENSKIRTKLEQLLDAPAPDSSSKEP
jgi:predicted O-methyltransferase YrrM